MSRARSVLTIRSSGLRSAATGLACAEAGIGYRVLSEPDRQLLVNVRWLAGFRERPADPDGERARMLSALAAGPQHDRRAVVRRRASRCWRGRC